MAKKLKAIDNIIEKEGIIMKTDIFMLAFPEIFTQTVEQIQEMNPEVLVESNFEQVYAMCKLGEVNKICIHMDVNNFNLKYGVARGQKAAEKIHEIDPEILILIWEGRSFINKDETIPDVFRLTGEIVPIKNKNELYIPFSQDINHFEITTKFFEGTLKKEDLLEYDFLAYDL